MTLSEQFLPGFLIQATSSNECSSDKKLIKIQTKNCLQIELKFKRLLGVQYYQFYVPTVLFALISYSNFFIPIIVITGRFLIISIPLVSILVIYQQVPEFSNQTLIDYWISFFFFYVLSMFAFLLHSLREFSNETLGPNHYVQALLNNTENPNKTMAYSNWKQHLKEQTERQHTTIVSVSYLKTDAVARYIYPVILIVFIILYTLGVVISLQKK